MYGARISLTIGFVAAFINLVIGVTYGGIAGYLGGKVDRIMMGIVDVLYGIPLLLYVILLMVVLGPGLTSIFVALGIAYWLNMARIVRSQILKVKTKNTSSLQKLWVFQSIAFYCVIFAELCWSNHHYLNIGHSRGYFTEAFLSFIGLV